MLNAGSTGKRATPVPLPPSLFPLPSSRYSISPPRSNLARVSATMRSRLALTSGGRSRRAIKRSASVRIESSACMKFPFFSLPVSSGMSVSERLLGVVLQVFQQNELRIVLANLSAEPDQVGQANRAMTEHAFLLPI